MTSRPRASESHSGSEEVLPAGAPTAMLVPALPLVVRRLGRISYAQGLEVQAQLVADRQAERVVDVLLLLEHEPVFTLGRNAQARHLRWSEAGVPARGFGGLDTGRGGDVTYAGA